MENTELSRRSNARNPKAGPSFHNSKPYCELIFIATIGHYGGYTKRDASASL